LPALYAEEVDRLSHRNEQSWNNILTRYRAEVIPRLQAAVRRGAARRLLALARSLNIEAPVLIESARQTSNKPSTGWRPSRIGPWTGVAQGPGSRLPGTAVRTVAHAHENALPLRRRARTHSRSTASTCAPNRSAAISNRLATTKPTASQASLPHSSAIEPWGRHMIRNSSGDHAGEERGVGDSAQLWRSNGIAARARAKWVHAGHTLLHDLKENVVTPTSWWNRWAGFTACRFSARHWSQALSALDRLAATPVRSVFGYHADHRQTGAAGNRRDAGNGTTRRDQGALDKQLGLRSSRITSALVEALRQRALTVEAGQETQIAAGEVERAGLTPETLNALVETLRRQYDLTARSASRHKERLTRTGFTLEEQVLTVDTALRMMGLTKNFARLVLFCAHGARRTTIPMNPRSIAELAAETRASQCAYPRDDGEQSNGAGALEEGGPRHSIRHAFSRRPDGHDDRYRTTVRSRRRSPYPSS